MLHTKYIDEEHNTTPIQILNKKKEEKRRKRKDDDDELKMNICEHSTPYVRV